MKVFWAWQSDVEQSVCRHFIKSALETAIQELSGDFDLDERPEIDHDTKNEIGMPDIVDSILQKIDAASAFVADLTTVARTEADKATANPNVLIELGYAKKSLGPATLVAVANSHWYQGPGDLPFDLRNRRGPITYNLAPGASTEEKHSVKKALVGALKNALKPILQNASQEKLIEAGDRTKNEWFTEIRSEGQSLLIQTAFRAQMELLIYPHAKIAKKSAELLSAARAAEITTFGWPIGLVLHDEHRPKPHADGIKAHINVHTDSGFGTSFDYWAMSSRGEFYSLMSLFEDRHRESNAIFFNTRIVRVAEALLFAGKLYSALGVPAQSKFTARVSHRNIAGRTLTSSTNNRSIFPTSTAANESNAEATLTVGNVSGELVDAVKTILEPLFMLFDFKQFGDSVYEDIIRRFERGDCS
jgi:hypothetical protein